MEIFYSTCILLVSLNTFQIFSDILILQIVFISDGFSKYEDLVILLLKTLQCLPLALRPKAKLSTLANEALCIRPLLPLRAPAATLALLVLPRHTGSLLVHRKFTCISASGPLYMTFFCLEYWSPHFLCDWLLLIS